MRNRNLTVAELLKANELLTQVREKLDALSLGNPDLLFAYRRKIYKELSYDERDKSMVRRRLKKAKRLEQAGLCAACNRPLEEKYVVLDRLNAAGGYTPENTRLICQACDVTTQESRRYA